MKASARRKAIATNKRNPPQTHLTCIPQLDKPLTDYKAERRLECWRVEDFDDET
jgi:hypothetical protein